MRPALEDEIRQLRARFWSDRDPSGRAFAPLADAYRRAGELEEAEDLLEDGRTRLPDFVPGHLVAARTFRDRGDDEAAARAYRRVLDLDPANLDALREAAELAEARDRTGEALNLWHRVVRNQPDAPSARERIRALKRRHFDVESAAPEVEPAAGPREDGAAEPEEEAAPAAAEDGAPEPAPSGAPASEPVAAEPAESAERGVPEAGEEGEPAAVEEGDEDSGVYTRTAAELYLRQGHREQALEVYRRLVERRPGDDELRARLEELESDPSAGRREVKASAPASGGETSGPPPAPDRPETGGGAPAADEEMETLAREWADGPGPSEELSTPFAWGREEEEREDAVERSPTGATIGSYFEEMLSHSPEAGGAEDEGGGSGADEVVPIEALAPDADPSETSGGTGRAS